MKDYSHCGKDVGAKVEMTPDEHQKRHQELHSYFEELMADFILHTNSLPSKTSLIDRIGGMVL